MKNIILVSVDALRKDMLGCYSSKDNLTPFIDSIQNKCIRFLSSYATGPYTQASFQGILASSYYLEYGKEKKLSSKKILISEILKENGIYTAAFHSNAYLSYYFGYKRGWDTFYDSMSDEVSDMYPFVRGAGINSKVSNFLSNFSFTKPLFLWVHYMDVHEPYIAEDRYLNKIDSSINLSKDDMFSMFKNVILKRDISDKSKVDTLKKLYMAKVSETDDYIKDLFSIFSKYNLLDNSTIILTSDHGDEFSEHGGLSHDGKMYSELLSVPLFIYDKTYNSKIIDTHVSLASIPPTICSLFKIEPSSSFKGKSLYPLNDIGPYTLYAEAIGKIGHKEKDSDRPIYCLIEDDTKVIYREDGNLWEAYNIAADPEEKTNILSSISEDLKDKLDKFINRNK